MIRNTISLIEQEEKDDVAKKDWCRTPDQKGEQDVNEQNQADKETDMATLEGNINELQISIDDLKSNIRLATEDLNTNRETQKTTTSTRKEKNALFHKELKNCQDVQSILAKAIEVLEKYYAFLHSHNAKKTYKEIAGKDSGGSNLERLSGKSVAELEEACSAKPECAGFNSAGWLKSAIAPEGEWYDWDEGSLYVKQLSESFLQEPVEGETETWGDTMDGQSEKGNEAISMLQFIEKESKTEMDDTINTEKKEQGDYGGRVGSPGGHRQLQARSRQHREAARAGSRGSRHHDEGEEGHRGVLGPDRAGLHVHPDEPRDAQAEPRGGDDGAETGDHASGGHPCLPGRRGGC